MVNFKFKILILFMLFFICIASFYGITYATNDNLQILKIEEEKYLIYISEHLNSQFEFAFNNNKNADKEKLDYRTSIEDSSNEKNQTAYINTDLYNKYFSNKVYLWARDLNKEYFIEAVEIDLNNVIEKNNVDLINNLTKIIKVNTENSITNQETINEVKITRTVGQIDILEEGTTYYQLIKLPVNEEYTEFTKIAEQIANKKIENNMYAKLEIANKFYSYYKKLVPSINDSNWIEVSNNTILQPEDSYEGEQYVLWLKNQNNKENKVDVQILTCFEEYKPKVISEKITTKLPITYDNPILFIILFVLVAAFVVVTILKKVNLQNSKRSK